MKEFSCTTDNPAAKMYLIPQSQWNSIPEDYKGRSVTDKSVRTVFEGAIPGNHGKGGTTLLFEKEHFNIIPDYST